MFRCTFVVLAVYISNFEICIMHVAYIAVIFKLLAFLYAIVY